MLNITSDSTAANHRKSKVVFVDHLKIALTVLVILHHAFITYGAPGGWYYSEKTSLPAAKILMTVFVAVNQSYFMGLFFFLSALFIPQSYDKKGAVRFLKDRFLRLGLPLIFYSFVLSPVVNYLIYYYAGSHHITFIQFLSGYDNWVSFGVLWFVAALLLFTVLYVIWRLVFPETNGTLTAKIPSVTAIMISGGCLGGVTFLARLVFPIGWTLDPVGFQLGHFPQYIVFFIFGIIAANGSWLQQLTYKPYKVGLIALSMIVFGLPMIFAIQAINNSPLSWFAGGFRMLSFLYSFWEQITGIAITAALLAIGKRNMNTPSQFLATLTRSTFAVYIIHPFVLIGLSLMLIGWNIEPVVKLLVVAPLSVLFSFVLGLIIVRIPGVNRIV